MRICGFSFASSASDVVSIVVSVVSAVFIAVVAAVVSEQNLHHYVTVVVCDAVAVDVDVNVATVVISSATIVAELRALVGLLFGMAFLVTAQVRLMLESFTAFVAIESSCVCDYR